MTRLHAALGVAAGALLAAATLAAPAGAQDREYERGYDRGRGPERAYDLAGPGVYLLAPELRDTPRGRAFVTRRFDFNRDGLVERDEARAANRAFRDGARLGPDRSGPDRFGPDRDGPDRFGPERENRRDRADLAPPPPPAGDYDRPAMRAYHFRQNRYGAVFTLQDVLFETGSARLRPTADAKLRPLAGYLRSHRAQALRVDGYTDSVGAAQANLILSRDRARSVADALTGMGVDGARLHLEGHGEDSPIASNLGADGRQQNRRVEVTLVGARAASFE